MPRTRPTSLRRPPFNHGAMAVTVYILECADQTLYTGCTGNLERRVTLHNSARGGAKYTRGRQPVRVVYQETRRTLAAGRKREAAIKRLSRQEKLALIASADTTLATA